MHKTGTTAPCHIYNSNCHEATAYKHIYGNTLSHIQTCITIIHDLDHLQQAVLMTALAVP